MRLITTTAIVALFSLSSHAQDRTVTKKTTVDPGKEQSVIASGCLLQAPGTDSFVLMGVLRAKGDELSVKSRAKVDDDGDDVRIKIESQTTVDDQKRVRSRERELYQLTPLTNVDLAPYVGRHVEVSAVMIKPGDGDANVKIKEKTKIDREHGRDSKSESETKAEVPRGSNVRLAVASVKTLAPSCH